MCAGTPSGALESNRERYGATAVSAVGTLMSRALSRATVAMARRYRTVRDNSLFIISPRFYAAAYDGGRWAGAGRRRAAGAQASRAGGPAGAPGGPAAAPQAPGASRAGRGIH